MWSRLLYFTRTFIEAGFSTFGLRGFYEQPAYEVLDRPGLNLEIRAYGPRLAVETVVPAGNRPAAERTAFNRLFRYIAGANRGGRTLAMTAPVQQFDPSGGRGQLIAMTTPVQTDRNERVVTMRFFLPRSAIQQGVPQPLDSQVHLVTLPAETLATLRFSGVLTDASRSRHEGALLHRLADSPWQATGQPFLLGYDPPFTIPTLRRNEVAVAVERRAAST